MLSSITSKGHTRNFSIAIHCQLLKMVKMSDSAASAPLLLGCQCPLFHWLSHKGEYSYFLRKLTKKSMTIWQRRHYDNRKHLEEKEIQWDVSKRKCEPSEPDLHEFLLQSSKGKKLLHWSYSDQDFGNCFWMDLSFSTGCMRPMELGFSRLKFIFCHTRYNEPTQKWLCKGSISCLPVPKCQFHRSILGC